MEAPERAAVFTEDVYRLRGKVTIVLPGPWESLSGETQALLVRILVAVNLPLNHVRILSRTEFGRQDLKTFAPASVIVFGCATDFSLPEYTFTAIDGVPVLKADALDALTHECKEKLWNAMKAFFRI